MHHTRPVRIGRQCNLLGSVGMDCIKPLATALE
jgi:hypothetical protein